MNLISFCRVTCVLEAMQARFQNEICMNWMDGFQVKCCRVVGGPVWHKCIKKDDIIYMQEVQQMMRIIYTHTDVDIDFTIIKCTH